MFVGTFILLVFAILSSSYSKKLPSYITQCRRHQPDVEQCLLNAVEQIRPYLLQGKSELPIPPLNPLKVPEASLNTGDNFKASFKNIQVFYTEEFQVTALKVDLDKILVDIALRFPRLRIKSNYNIDGRLLILQLQGQGSADGNFTDVRGRAVVNGKIVMKNGKEYANVEDTRVSLKLGKPVFYFDKLFGDNEELNIRTNQIINENIESILEELAPVAQDTVATFIVGIVSRIFNRYSLDELFPN